MAFDTTPHPRQRDRGAVLPLVLVVVFVLGLIVVAIAEYTTTTLSFGRISEARADRFAAAQAAIDDGIERLEIKRTLCGTNAGTGGITEPFPEVINGAPATVRCQVVGGTAGDLDGWAVVLTDEGSPDESLFVQSGGGVDKSIHGPIWMEDETSMRLLAPLELVGDLVYPGGCNPSQVTSLSLDPDLSFGPGHTTWCTTGSWSSLFREPAASPPSTLSLDDGGPGTLDANGCTVFRPGRYTTLPVLGEFNYFQSGTYYFYDIAAEFELNNEHVLFGNMQGVEGFPSIAMPACDLARGSDSASGATVYMAGRTRFHVGPNSSLEFSRRLQIGATRNFVSVHVLRPSGLTHARWDNDGVVHTQPGNDKELAVHGLVWAPYALLEFGEVTGLTTAALRGGAVLAKLDLGASASATGVLIEIANAPIYRALELTSTATKDGGQTQIRAILEWRPTTGETALKSWRVCGGGGC